MRRGEWSGRGPEAVQTDADVSTVSNQLVRRITKRGHRAMKPRSSFSDVDSLRMTFGPFSGLNALYGSVTKPCTATVSFRLLSRDYARIRPEDRIRAMTLSGKCRRSGSAPETDRHSGSEAAGAQNRSRSEPRPG